MSDSIEAELQNTIRNDRDLETGVRMFAERLLVVVLADETIRLDRVLSMEAHRFPELGKLFYESGPGRVEDALAKYLREKVSQGIVSVPNPQLAAEQFIDLDIGTFQRRAVPDIERSTPRERKLRVNAAVDLFLKAYLVQE